MMQLISDALLNDVSARITETFGLRFPPNRWGDLVRGLRSAAGTNEPEKLARYASRIVNSSLSADDMRALVAHLTVGETYFFREGRVFDTLRTEIFPKLIERRRDGSRHIAVCSAACSSGEEPYSVAILLSQLLPDIEDWDIRIVGLDVNEELLAKAEHGVYSEWSFRNTSDWLKRSFFTQIDHRHYVLDARIRSLVRFQWLNLAEDTWPSRKLGVSDFDIVFCRNVLMYMSKGQVAPIVDRLRRSLSDGGRLIVGSCEPFDALTERFARTGDSVIFKKRIGRESTAEAAQDWRQSEPLPIIPPLSMPTRTERPVVAKPVGTKPKIKRTPPNAWDEDPSELLREAERCADLRRLSKAEDLCARVVEIDPFQPMAYYLLANIRHEQGLDDEAVDAFRRSIYIDPGFVMAYVHLGNLMIARGSYMVASRHLENARALLVGCSEDETVPGSGDVPASRLLSTVSMLIHQTQGAARG